MKPLDSRIGQLHLSLFTYFKITFNSYSSFKILNLLRNSLYPTVTGRHQVLIFFSQCRTLFPNPSSSVMHFRCTITHLKCDDVSLQSAVITLFFLSNSLSPLSNSAFFELNITLVEGWRIWGSCMLGGNLSVVREWWGDKVDSGGCRVGRSHRSQLVLFPSSFYSSLLQSPIRRLFPSRFLPLYF